MTEFQSKQNNRWVSIWVKPRATLKSILDSDPLRTIIPLSIVSGVVSAISWLGFLWTRFPYQKEYRLALFALALLIVGGLFGLLNLYLGGWLYRITGSWLGGKGEYRAVKCAVGWSAYPFIMSGILGILSYIFYHYPLLSLLFGVLNLIVLIWAFILFLHLIGEAHQFSAWKALVAILIGAVLIFIAAILISLLLPLLKPLFSSSLKLFLL